MAIHAVADITRRLVVKMYIRPAGGGVAGFAVVAGRHVYRRLAGCAFAIVAFHAAVNNAFMVEHADVPGNAGVAGAAIIAGAHMREGLAYGLLVVMAFLAGLACHLVIEAGDGPGGGAVAVFAGFR